MRVLSKSRLLAGTASKGVTLSRLPRPRSRTFIACVATASLRVLLRQRTGPGFVSGRSPQCCSPMWQSCRASTDNLISTALLASPVTETDLSLDLRDEGVIQIKASRLSPVSEETLAGDVSAGFVDRYHRG
jgi:hypothetical protein